MVIFDLDDTLYSEIEYVKSGFKEVAEFLSLHVKKESQEIYQKLLYFLKKDGRGRVFDSTISSYIKPNKTLVKKSLSLYRKHHPKISLDQEAIKLLEFLQINKIPIYLVTDGNALVQERKIKALGLSKYVKKAFVTHRYGRSKAKPSAYCFEKIAKLEGVAPEEIVYIADNPHKDFVGIKPLGFQTIRLKQGMFKDVTLNAQHEAKLTFNSIKELFCLLDKMKNDKSLYSSCYIQ